MLGTPLEGMGRCPRVGLDAWRCSGRACGYLGLLYVGGSDSWVPTGEGGGVVLGGLGCLGPH